MDAVTLVVVVAWCSCGLGHGVMGASDPDLGAPPLTSVGDDNHLPPVTDNQVHLTTEIVKQVFNRVLLNIGYINKIARNPLA